MSRDFRSYTERSQHDFEHHLGGRPRLLFSSGFPHLAHCGLSGSARYRFFKHGPQWSLARPLPSFCWMPCPHVWQQSICDLLLHMNAILGTTSTSLAHSRIHRPPPLMPRMARYAQHPEVGHLIRSTLTLRHDMVHMCPLAMHQAPTHLALIAISEQHLTPCSLPPLGAVAPLVSGRPADVGSPWLGLPVDPRRPERRYSVWHVSP
jgi:hypothetical protein